MEKLLSIKKVVIWSLLAHAFRCRDCWVLCQPPYKINYYPQCNAVNFESVSFYIYYMFINTILLNTCYQSNMQCSTFYLSYIIVLSQPLNLKLLKVQACYIYSYILIYIYIWIWEFFQCLINMRTTAIYILNIYYYCLFILFTMIFCVFVYFFFF